MCMNSYQEVPAELHARWTGARADEDEIEDDDEDEVVSIYHFKVELLLSSCPTLHERSARGHEVCSCECVRERAS